MLAQTRPRMSFDEYCALDSDSPVKHEFFEGQAWAMAGGSREHAALAANVLGLLAAQLRGGNCQAHTSDLRIRVRATGLATYPDVSVICGRAELDPDDPRGHTVLNPSVLIEILSPSTEEYDRGEKLAHYQRIAALREVLLIAQQGPLAEVWRRQPTGEWKKDEYRDGTVRLEAIACDLPLTEVYRDPLAGRAEAP